MTISGRLRPYRVVIFLLILTAFLLRIPILKTRVFDPDEFQHLHVARQIYHGDIPYKDYFEHHTPFLHFVLTGLYPIFGEEIRIVFAARALMLIFTAAILYLTFVLGKTLYDTDTGLFAALFLSYVIMFLEKTLEIRPDLPAVTFWLATLIFMVKGIKWRMSALSWRWYMLSGLMMGMAIMSTQKALFALGGMSIALAWMLFDPRREISWKRSLKLSVIFFLGTMIPVAIMCAFFYFNDALWQFINCNFIINSRWKLKFLPFNYIRQLLRQNPFFSVIGILGLFTATFWMHKREEITKGGFVLVFCAYFLIAGLFIMPVPYRQYYQLFLPLLAIHCGIIFSKVAAVNIRHLIRDLAHGKLRPVYVGFTLLAINLMIAGLILTLRLSKPVVLNSGKFYLLLWIALIVLAVPVFIFNKGRYAALLISIGIIAFPLQQTVDQLSSDNSGQLGNVKYIMDVTTEEDTVLDGWSGYGFLRPHAYYYYFLHSEMRAMLNEKESSDDIIDSLEKNHTKVVIYDSAIKALPKKLQNYIKSNYAKSGHGNIYIRK